MTTQILVVDDDPDIRQLISELLSDEGFTVVERSDVTTALAHVQTERPAGAVVDYRLPDGEGTEITEVLRVRGVPSLIVSAHPKPDDPVARAQPWMAKPFGISELLGAVHAMVDRTPMA